MGEPYLHASKASHPNKKKQLNAIHSEGMEIKDIDTGDLAMLGSSDNYVKKELNLSTDQKTMWKIRTFSEYIDE